MAYALRAQNALCTTLDVTQSSNNLIWLFAGKYPSICLTNNKALRRENLNRISPQPAFLNILT